MILRENYCKKYSFDEKNPPATYESTGRIFYSAKMLQNVRYDGYHFQYIMLFC